MPDIYRSCCDRLGVLRQNRGIRGCGCRLLTAGKSRGDRYLITGVRPRDHVEDKPQDELAPLLAERYGASPEGMQKEVSRFYAELAGY